MTPTASEPAREPVRSPRNGRPLCSARIGWKEREQGWGRTPIDCRQQVGLRTFRDAAGRTRRFCSRAGHRAAAVRRYGEWAEPEQADPITAGKGWTEAELREAWGR